MVIIVMLVALLIFSLYQSMKGNYVSRRPTRKVEPSVGSTYPSLQYRGEKVHVKGGKDGGTE